MLVEKLEVVHLDLQIQNSAFGAKRDANVVRSLNSWYTYPQVVPVDTHGWGDKYQPFEPHPNTLVVTRDTIRVKLWSNRDCEKLHFFGPRAPNITIIAVLSTWYGPY